MATYARNGRLFAMQFAGPEQVIKNLAKRNYPFKPFNVWVDCFNNEIRQEYIKRCPICHETFTTESRTARFCPLCKDAKKKEGSRERVRNHRLRNANSKSGVICNAF